MIFPQIFPHTASRRIVLHPATARDQETFTQIFMRTGVESVRPGAAGRARGARGGRGMGQAYAAFLIAQRGRDRRQLGFGTLHGLDPAGHIRCGVYLDPRHGKLGVGTEAILLLINYAFATLPVDRVIGQTTEASFASFGLTAEHDGGACVLRDHLYFRGSLWDLHTFQIERRDWESYVDGDTDVVLPKSVRWRTPPADPLQTAS